jgi:broad specificity phosphatase PhoE
MARPDVATMQSVLVVPQGNEAGRLWLVRHGRTAWNGSRFLGRADVGLDPVGRAQARAAARALATEPVDVVWTSPLRRASATAAEIAAAQPQALPPPVDRPELIELDCGEWEGRPKGTMKIGRRDPDDRLAGGESIADVARRVGALAGELLAEVQRGRRVVVVVGHYFAGRLLHAALIGIPVGRALHDPRYCPGPGSVHEIFP